MHCHAEYSACLPTCLRENVLQVRVFYVPSPSLGERENSLAPKTAWKHVTTKIQQWNFFAAVVGLGIFNLVVEVHHGFCTPEPFTYIFPLSYDIVYSMNI